MQPTYFTSSKQRRLKQFVCKIVTYYSLAMTVYLPCSLIFASYRSLDHSTTTLFQLITALCFQFSMQFIRATQFQFYCNSSQIIDLECFCMSTYLPPLYHNSCTCNTAISGCQCIYVHKYIYFLSYGPFLVYIVVFQFNYLFLNGVFHTKFPVERSLVILCNPHLTNHST